MGNSQKNMCPFSYWRATEGQIQNAQVLSISSKPGDKKKGSVEAQALSRLALNKNAHSESNKTTRFKIVLSVTL